MSQMQEYVRRIAADLGVDDDKSLEFAAIEACAYSFRLSGPVRLELFLEMDANVIQQQMISAVASANGATWDIDELEAEAFVRAVKRIAAPCPQAASAVTAAGGPTKQGRRPERLITAALQHVVTSVANGASVVQGIKPLFLSKGKAQEFNQPTSAGEAVLSAVVKDVLEAVGGMVADSRQRHAAEYGGKLDSIFLPGNGAKPHLDATARAMFLQWIKTKAENAIKQSKSPSCKDAEQATPVKAITGTGKDRRASVAPATPSGDEVQGEMAAAEDRANAKLGATKRKRRHQPA
ncbi:hypothetical protein V8C86DRAFT_2679990 [Haematococcus lacustris]